MLSPQEAKQLIADVIETVGIDPIAKEAEENRVWLEEIQRLETERRREREKSRDEQLQIAAQRRNAWRELEECKKKHIQNEDSSIHPHVKMCFVIIFIATLVLMPTHKKGWVYDILPAALIAGFATVVAGVPLLALLSSLFGKNSPLELEWKKEKEAILIKYGIKSEDELSDITDKYS